MKTPVTKRMSVYYDKIALKQNEGNIYQSPELERQYKKLISSLTALQKKTVINFINLAKVYLSTKAKSRVDTKSNDLNQILVNITNACSKNLIIKNVGQNTKDELSAFSNNIKKYVETITSFDSVKSVDVKNLEELIITVFNLKKFSILPFFRPNVAKGNLQLFKLIEFLFKNSFIKKQRDFEVIFYSTNFFKANRKKLKKLAAEFNLTNERIRQLKVNHEKTVLQKLQLISTISNYIIPFLTNKDLFSKSFIIVNDEFAEQSNNEQKTSFSTYFMAHIISGMVKEKFDQIKIGNDINKFFFIDNEYLKYFEFQKFSGYLLKLRKSRNPFDYQLSYYETVKKYFLVKTKNNKVLLDLSIKSFIGLFLGTTVDNKGNFTIKANVRPKLYEIIFDILRKKDAPMHISEIFAILKSRYNYKRTPIAVCGIINSRTDLFISFGKTSTFGLREWEKKKSDIKGGTIRDIVEEYLLKYNAPKHISEIHKYVCRYRKTSSSNILSNFQLETTNRFYLFKGYFVGLQNHSYKFDDFKFNSIPTNLWKLVKPMLLGKKTIKKTEIIRIFMDKFSLQEIQMEYYIEQKIKTGELILQNGMLGLGKSRKK